MKLAFKEFFVKINELNLPIFFFTGPEAYLKLRAKERILARSDLAGYSKTHLDGPGLDVGLLWDALSSPQLFTRGEIIIIERADRIGAPAKRSLLEILENWQEGNTASKVIIFISQDDRIDAADPLEGHLMTSPKAYHVFFPVLTENEVVSWAKGEFKRRGLAVSSEIMERAAGAFSNDIYNWINMIRALELCAGPAGEVKLEDAREFLGSFSFQEERILGDFQRLALEALALKKTEEELFGRMTAAMERLLGASPESDQTCVLRALRVFADLVYELGVAKSGVYSSFRKRFPEVYYQLQKAAPLLSWPDIKGFYAALIEAERNIKTGRLEARSAFQEFTAVSARQMAGRSGRNLGGGPGTGLGSRASAVGHAGQV
ncbi:MAG: hypothetical protein HY401_08815 [Elusimicrobia bacterium]|nr:hypothetical protein [Elusimicrobiota bacterium]